MKRVLATVFCVFLLFSCKKENEMDLNVTITGLKKGTVYLQKIDDSTLINIDSITVKGNENFSFATTVENPEIFYLYLDKVDGNDYNDRIEFFGEKGTLQLKTHLSKLNSEVAISGSKSQKVFEDYKKHMKHINNALGKTQLELIQAQLSNDEELMVAADKRQIKLLKAKYSRAIQFALNHKKSTVAAYIGAREIPEANKTYLDSIYNGLSKKAKKSLYGKELKDLISE